MDKARVSRALILMDKKALITRMVDKHDKRVAHISLTDAGRSLYGQIEPEVMVWNTRLAAEMPDNQHSQLVEALKSVKVWCAQNYQGGDEEE